MLNPRPPRFHNGWSTFIKLDFSCPQVGFWPLAEDLDEAKQEPQEMSLGTWFPPTVRVYGYFNLFSTATNLISTSHHSC